MSQSSKAACRLVRPSNTYDGKQGLSYFEGIAAETVGSRAICMHLLTIPPGGRAKVHMHENHETAIYSSPVRRTRSTATGSNIAPISAPAISSTFRPACRICRSTSATSRSPP